VLTPTRSRRAHGPGVALLLVLSAFVVAAQQQQPPFRAGTNFVRVDVYPTRNGVPVDDLAVTDFQVAEDGVPQKIESFEHIVVNPAAVGEGVDPGSPSRANELVANPHRRVFVV
jgi:hypothetical protein